MTAADLIKAFETLAEAPEGVARLRELVLQLAVRGKLVPQDSEDEPAGVLLERIAAEKARLVREGKIRQQKELPPVSSGEVAFDVPQGWRWARFQSITDIGAGVTKGRKLGGRKTASFLYLRVANVQAGFLNLEVIKEIAIPVEEYDRYSLAPGDVLLTEGGDWDKLGRSAIWSGQIAKCLHQNHIFRARPILHDAVGPRWLSMFMNSPDGRGYFQSCSKQTTNLASINKTQLRSCPVPVPPAAEQHRIVARVDELMGLLDRLETARNTRNTTRVAARDAALAALRQAETPEEVDAAWNRLAERLDDLITDPADIEPLRQTVLQLAVRGRLVPQDPGDEPAEALLERIAEEKARLVREKVVRRRKPQEALIASDLPFSLPSGWTWSRIDDLIYALGDGPHYSPKYVEAKGGVPFLSTRNITTSGFRLSDMKYVSRKDHHEFCKRIRAEPGDILYTKGGTTGMAIVNDLDFEFSVWVHVAILKVAHEHLAPRYIALALNAPHCYEQSQKYTHGTGNRDLGLTRMVKITAPIPPLPEQHRIVAKVDQFMSIIDRLAERLTAARDTQGAFAAAAAVHHLES